MIKTRIRPLFTVPKPAPSFQNVEPAGEGWYRFGLGKWRRSEAGNYDGAARYLTEAQLLDFALEAVRFINKGD